MCDLCIMSLVIWSLIGFCIWMYQAYEVKGDFLEYSPLGLLYPNPYKRVLAIIILGPVIFVCGSLNMIFSYLRSK